MLFEAFILTIVLIVITVILLNSSKSNSKEAPGPTGLPIIGYYQLIVNNPVPIIAQLVQTYGQIFKVRLLGQNYYFLNSLELVREAFVAKGEYTSGRPTGFSPVNVLIRESFSVTNGQKWKAQRKLFMKAMTNLGVGKRIMETKVKWQVDKLVEDIESLNGVETDFLEILTLFTINVMSVLLYGVQYREPDLEYIGLRDTLLEFTKYFPGIDIILSGRLFWLLCLYRSHNLTKLHQLYRRNREYFLKIVNQRLTNWQDTNPETVLDFCIEKHLEEQKERPKEEYFDKESMADIMFDNILGGSDQPTAFLYYGLLIMVQKPEIQEKMFAEIEKVIGTERSVSLDDRPHLPYTMAVINELQRSVDVLPYGFPHVVTENITIGGYDVPKGSNLVFHLSHILKDGKYFKNPNEFDPSNFLDENGDLVKNPANIPFGIGQRSCVGFSLSQIEWFLALVSLVQKFHWLPPTTDPTDLLNVKQQGEGVPRLENFKIRAITRN